MCLVDLGLVWALVGEVVKVLATEALEFAYISSILLSMISVCFSIGRVVVVVL